MYSKWMVRLNAVRAWLFGAAVVAIAAAWLIRR